MDQAETRHDAMNRFHEEVWRTHVRPLLKGNNAAQREKLARRGTKVAAATGRMFDNLLKLRGKPFTRSLSVMGGSLGAMLPDLWSWTWFRDEADQPTRQFVSDTVSRQARSLPVKEACALLGIEWPPQEAALREAWRRCAYEFHPDRARTPGERIERELKFRAAQAAYDVVRTAIGADAEPRPKNG